MTLPSTGTKPKPVLDENSFQQILEAAHIVQQHNDGSPGADSRLDTPKVLAEIAEIQSRMRSEGLDVAAACGLIAERLRTRCGATGVSVSIVTDGYLDCVAEAGAPAKLPGSSVASHSLVATERLKSGEIFESRDVQTDIRMDQELCRQLGVGCLIAVPIQVHEELAGVIEVRWDRSNAYKESDTRACQLMASLATGMLERKARARQRDGTVWALPRKDAPAAPFSVPASENLASSDPAASLPIGGTLSEQRHELSLPQPHLSGIDSLAAECGVCGRPFGPDEAFCGHCSRPRAAGESSDKRLQSKWASLWYMQQAQETAESLRDSAPLTAKSAEEPPASAKHPILADTPEKFPAPRFSSAERITVSPERTAWHDQETHPEALQLPAAAANAAISTSTSDTQWWRRTLLTVRLPMRPRNVALIVGVAVLLLVIAAAWPAPKNGQLTWFESLLVEMGLAQAPASAPVYIGKPDIRVWEDVHTALYYCEGSDMYGKTPGGRFATQREAQQDQFESATRTACQ